MKHKIAAVVLVGALLLTGCGTSTSGSQQGSTMANTGNRAGTMENAVQTTAAQTQTQSAITREQAESIALEHAGFTADQVARLRTEYEIDDGVPRFEVQFHQGRWEYDYEINANTGDILSWDRDD